MLHNICILNTNPVPASPSASLYGVLKLKEALASSKQGKKMPTN